MNNEKIEYQKSFENCRLAKVIIGEKLQIKTCNKQFELLSGYSKQEIKGGIKWDSFFKKKDYLRFINLYDQITEVSYEIEHKTFTFINKQANTKKVEITVESILGRKEVLISILDITEQEKTKKELKTASNYLENLLNYANAPIIVWDSEFKITKFNRAFELLTGRKAEEVLGKPLEILFPQKRYKEVLEHIKQTTAGSRWVSVEIPILRTDGMIRTVIWNSATIYQPDGKTIESTIAQGQDITEQEKAKKELKETSNYLENLLNYANAPIIVWDSEFKITKFNRAFELLTGRNAEEVLGKPLEILFPQKRYKEILEHIKQTTAGSRWVSVEIPILRTDGMIRTVIWNSATIYQSDGKTIESIIAQGQDITEQKEAEDKLKMIQLERERVLEILQNQKKELGEFVHIIAHDIGSFLTIISGYTSLLFKEQKILYKEKIEAEINRIHKFVKRSAELAKAGIAIERTNCVDLNEIVQEIAQLNIPKNIKFTCDKLLKVRGDKEKVFQIFNNLIRNAVEHGQPKNIKIKYKTSTKRLQILVINDGTPIPNEERIKLLDLNISEAIKRYSKKGMGLAIVKNIVEAHKWQLSFKSDTLTTFIITIPNEKEFLCYE